MVSIMMTRWSASCHIVVDVLDLSLAIVTRTWGKTPRNIHLVHIYFYVHTSLSNIEHLHYTHLCCTVYTIYIYLFDKIFYYLSCRTYMRLLNEFIKTNVNPALSVVSHVLGVIGFGNGLSSYICIFMQLAAN